MIALHRLMNAEFNSALFFMSVKLEEVERSELLKGRGEGNRLQY